MRTRQPRAGRYSPGHRHRGAGRSRGRTAVRRRGGGGRALSAGRAACGVNPGMTDSRCCSAIAMRTSRTFKSAAICLSRSSRSLSRIQVATSSFLDRPMCIRPPTSAPTASIKSDSNPGVDVLEPVVECLFGDPFAVQLKKRRQELLCNLRTDDLLAFQHQYVSDIHQHVRIRNIPGRNAWRRGTSSYPPSSRPTGVRVVLHRSSSDLPHQSYTLMFVCGSIKSTPSGRQVRSPAGPIAGDNRCYRHVDELLDDARYDRGRRSRSPPPARPGHRRQLHLPSYGLGYSRTLIRCPSTSARRSSTLSSTGRAAIKADKVLLTDMVVLAQGL